MKSSQYHNIIKHNLRLEYESVNCDSLFVVGNILNNLKTPLPCGKYGEVINNLRINDYWAWRECSIDDAQTYANDGIVTIGIDSCNLVIIPPEFDTENIPHDIIAPIYSNQYARTISQLLPEEKSQMSFFVYNQK